MKKLVTFCRHLFPRIFYNQLTFTYYVPSPPQRKHGYQEKEFDEIIHSLLAEDVRLLEITPCPHNQPDRAGMWLICKILAPKGKKVLVAPMINSDDENTVEWEGPSQSNSEWKNFLHKHD